MDKIKKKYMEVTKMHSKCINHNMEQIDEKAKEEFLKTHDHLLSIEEVDKVIEEVRKNVK